MGTGCGRIARAEAFRHFDAGIACLGVEQEAGEQLAVRFGRCFVRAFKKDRYRRALGLLCENNAHDIRGVMTDNDMLDRLACGIAYIRGRKFTGQQTAIRHHDHDAQVRMFGLRGDFHVNADRRVGRHSPIRRLRPDDSVQREKKSNAETFFHGIH